VTETRVEVRVDLTVRYSSRLSRMATQQVLPAARRERDATKASAQQRQIARERLVHCAAHRPWLSRTTSSSVLPNSTSAPALRRTITCTSDS
jgi:hypothetical protein